MGTSEKQIFTAEQLSANTRIAFANGVRVDIHAIKDGNVYYQRWAPGVESQGALDNLYRLPTAEFIRQANLALE